MYSYGAYMCTNKDEVNNQRIPEYLTLTQNSEDHQQTTNDEHQQQKKQTNTKTTIYTILDL